MLRLAWSGVRHNTGRYIATLIAIITGIAFFAATGFLSDRVIDSLEGDVNREFGAVDAAVVPDDSGDAASEAFVNDLRLSGDTYDRIAAADGVEGTAGILTGTVGFLADDGTTFGDGATGRLWVADEELNPLQLVEGTAPTAAGELTVDRGLADEESLQVGDPVTVLTQAGQFDATIVGITAFGSADSIDDGGTVTLPEATAFDWLAAGQVEYEDIYLRGSGSQDDLVAAVEPLVPDGFQAQTGDDVPRGSASGDRRLRRGPQAGSPGVRAPRAVRRWLRDLQHLQRDRGAAAAGARRAGGRRAPRRSRSSGRCGSRGSSSGWWALRSGWSWARPSPSVSSPCSAPSASRCRAAASR